MAKASHQGLDPKPIEVSGSLWLRLQRQAWEWLPSGERARAYNDLPLEDISALVSR